MCRVRRRELVSLSRARTPLLDTVSPLGAALRHERGSKSRFAKRLTLSVGCAPLHEARHSRACLSTPYQSPATRTSRAARRPGHVPRLLSPRWCRSHGEASRALVNHSRSFRRGARGAQLADSEGRHAGELSFLQAGHDGLASNKRLSTPGRQPRPRPCPGACVHWQHYVCDRRHHCRQVSPRGLGARRGSTRSGQKEPALPGQHEPQRGNGVVPAALRRLASNAH